jgi:hypothetical protein
MTKLCPFSAWSHRYKTTRPQEVMEYKPELCIGEECAMWYKSAKACSLTFMSTQAYEMKQIKNLIIQLLGLEDDI